MHLIIAPVLFSIIAVCMQTVISPDRTASNPVTVGFALTVDRAVVSVRYSNLLMEDIVELNACEEYVELMRNFSDPSSEHPRYDEHHKHLSEQTLIISPAPRTILLRTYSMTGPDKRSEPRGKKRVSQHHQK